MQRILSIFGMLAILSFVFSCEKEIRILKDKFKDKGCCDSLPPPPPPPSGTNCGTPLMKELFDMGGVFSWGTIAVSNDATNIKVKIADTLKGFFITKVTLVYGSLQHVTADLNNQINWTPCEGPALFDLQKTYTPATITVDSIMIPGSNFQADGCIWLSVNVQLQGTVGGLGCAYASPFDSTVIGSAQWQSAFKYCKQNCSTPPPPPPSDCGQLRTETPGGWGASPHGDNPGTYLHKHFASAFPDGLTVGCSPDNYHVHFTSAEAITSYLPAGGDPKALKANYTDPATRFLKNELVSQLVALTLSVGFDKTDPNFGKAGINLGDMLIGSGMFKGWTVQAFLDEANKVLGGCDNKYSPSQIEEAADKINENYDDGSCDKKFLVCPHNR